MSIRERGSRSAGLRPVVTIWLLGAFATLLTGCRLPDITGFSESAATLRASLDQAEAAYAPFVGDNLDQAQKRDFDDNWKKIEGSADALVAYAQSLDALVSAGKKGSEGAKELAGSVDQLLSRVGVAGIAASEITSMASDVWGLAAQGIAAKQLAEATGEAHPYVDAICRVIADKVAANLANDFDTIYEKVQSEIDGAHPDVSGAWDLLTARRARLTSSIAGQDPSSWAQTDLDQLNKIDLLLTQLRPQAEKWKKRIREAERLRDTQKALMLQIGAAARALASEHGALKAAILANKTLNMTNVMFASEGLRDLVNRVEEIKDNG